MKITNSYNKSFSRASYASIIASFVCILLVYALLTGITYKFYASILFLFYYVLNKMWLSVIGLGVFQTLLMIPIRITNLRNSQHIKEFEDELRKVKGSNNQQFLIKKTAREGNVNFLFYVVNFFIQTISYISIGRLFLTNYYSRNLNPDLLYSFVPYPEYPIKGVFFKLPYISFSETIDLGMKWVLVAWVLAFFYKIAVSRVKKFFKKDKTKDHANLVENKVLKWCKERIKGFINVSSSSILVLFICCWFILRNLPITFKLVIFSGDVGKPNPRFNLITAVVTAFTILWLNIPKIVKKVKLAKSQGLPVEIIKNTQISLFKETLRSSAVFGLGAYFITRKIPSAFELSIFTFEVISWVSPFTLDKLILPNKK